MIHYTDEDYEYYSALAVARDRNINEKADFWNRAWSGVIDPEDYDFEEHDRG